MSKELKNKKTEQSKPKKEKVKFNKKAIWITVIAVVLAVAIGISAFFLIDRLKDKNNPSNENAYLTLNAYNITLNEGETYQLELKKIDGKGNESTVENATYTSETSLVAKVENGLITALDVGTCYVQVKADGLTVACFVTVKQANKANGYEIKIVEDCLYVGIPINLYLYSNENGVIKEFDGAITWSVEDETTLSISNGVVTALKTSESTIIKATFTVNGQEQTIEKEISIEEPFIYQASSLEVSVASSKTLSGDDNPNQTTMEKTLSVQRYNPVTKQTELLTANDFEVKSSDENVAIGIKDGNGIKLQAKSIGETNLIISINGKLRMAIVVVKVVTPIASVADMDALAIACHNNPEALSQNYMLVKNIDYKGQVIYPIGTAKEPSTNREIGIQWKYILQAKKAGGSIEYSFVPRDKVGEHNGNGYYGLSDNEFIELAKNGGINPNNKTLFTGTFDGNGFSIENAKMMNDAFLASFNQDTTKVGGSYSSIFPHISGATIKNIGFKNISYQVLSEFTVKGWNDSIKPLFYYYDRASSSIKKSVSGTMEVVDSYRALAIIGMAWGNSTVENVYFDLDYSSLKSLKDNGSTSVFIHWDKYTKVSNCVVNLRNGTGRSKDCIINSGKGNTGSYKNNLFMGAVNAEPTYTNKELENGNAWVKTNNVEDLKKVEVGVNADASKVKTIDEIIASFDTNIWDMTGFINGKDLPQLKQNCSI